MNNKRNMGPDTHRIKVKFAKAQFNTLGLPLKVIQGQLNDLLYVFHINMHSSEHRAH